MEGLCWRSYILRRLFDTYGRYSYSSTSHDIIITLGGSCRCWKSSGKLPGYNFVCYWVWCNIWLHSMFWNADGLTLHDYCIVTAASKLSESFPTEESLLWLCTLGWIWWFECFYVNEKWSRVDIWDWECPHKPLILWALCNTIYFDVPEHYGPVKSD